MNFSFQNKNILISGGSQGIGKAMALEIAAQGGNLFLVARDKKNLLAAQQDILERYPNINCEVHSAAVEKSNEVKIAVEQMLKKMKRIDGVICNAGFARTGYFNAMPLADFEESMQVNYFGALYLAYFVAPHLREGSFISFTSSVVGYMGIFGYSAYAPSKFALMGLGETLLQEFREKKIQVSVLCPPDTATAGFEKENLTKPDESKALGNAAGIMDAQVVARRFLKQLAKGKFLITVNFESWLFYRLHGAFPDMVKKVIFSLMSRTSKL